MEMLLGLDISCGRMIGDERRGFQFWQSQRWAEAAAAGD